MDNAGDTADVTRLRLIPLDASAHVLRGVKVTTLFGTDRERAVIPRGSTYDILRFSGPGFRRVRVAVTALKAVDFPPARQAIVERHLDRRGRVVPGSRVFERVRLSNPNPDALTVRILMIRPVTVS